MPPLRRRRGARATLAAAGAITAALAAATPAVAQLGPEPEVLNLFQRIARSDLVALVQVRDGALNYATVDVLESLKGTAPVEHLRIAFRDLNFTRAPGQDVVVFPNGQKEILFLVPYKTPRRKKDIEKFKDLFTLLKGRQGRMTLPAEGPEIVLQALRRLTEITRLDAAQQVDMLRDLLTSTNPYLLETSLEEIDRLRAGDAALLPRLQALLRSPSPTLRARSLSVIGQVFRLGSAAAADDHLDEERATLAAVLERARNDDDEQVRVRAVAAIAAWPTRHEVEGDLRAIAGADRAQAVRYEAEKALFRR